MKEIALVFSRLGMLGFGGPLATVAMMEEETVRKRRWVSPDQFTEMYAVCKLLPGPISTQMAVYLGRVRGGIRGGILAGALFILPSFLLVLGISYLYVHSGLNPDQRPPAVDGFFSGLQSAALAVIIMSTYSLARPYLRRQYAWGVAIVSALSVFIAPRFEPLVILIWGAYGGWRASGGGRFVARSISPFMLQLFWTCFKAGSLVFGTGLAVVPMLEADVVQRFEWLTRSEFMDGIAIGQVTPGPVVITATFIGYKVAGLAGAVAATIGMFLPAFILILFIVPRIWKRLSGTPAAAGFSAWAIPAVVGGILGTSAKLGAVVIDAPTVAGIFALSLLVALKFKWPAWALIPAGGALGTALTLFT